MWHLKWALKSITSHFTLVKLKSGNSIKSYQLNKRKIIISFETAWLFTCRITNIISDNTSLSNAMNKPNRNLPEIFLKIFLIAVNFFIVISVCLGTFEVKERVLVSVCMGLGVKKESKGEGRRQNWRTLAPHTTTAPNWPFTDHPSYPQRYSFHFLISYQILWTILKSKWRLLY